MRGAYQHWHEVLGNEFFGASQAFRSTVLYVNDEVQQHLAEHHGIEVSLPQAVAEELNWDDPHKALLHRIESACFLWKSRGSPGPPPSLPLLALSVLAATRMESSGDMLRSNFYGRWTHLFGEEVGTPRAKKLVNAFEDVATLWEQLSSWLDETGGLCGTSTVSTGEHHRKIGYPISQALVRSSDRQILTRFFAATRLRPNNPTEVSGRELLRRLRAWTAGRDRHFSPRLMDELKEAGDSSDTLIVSLLRRLADDWDGKLHEPERGFGRRALGLRLVVADRGKRLEWLAETVDELPETAVSLSGGRGFTLRQDYGGAYSGLETLHPSTQQLTQGLRLEGSDLVAEWTPQEVVLLRKHPHLGDWVSTEYFEPGEQHWILAADSAVSEVRSMVESLGGRTIREVLAPVAGWKLFKGVRAVSGSAFTQTLDQGGRHTHVLEPQIRQQTKLAGGLRIASEYRAGSGVAGHYMRHGVPDLLLPPGDGPDHEVEVVLDGRTQKLRADPRVPFPLWVVPLEEGAHTVGTPGSSQTFTVHDGLHEALPPRTGMLGYPCNGTARSELLEVDDEDHPAIRGAYAPDSIRLPRIELVRGTVLEAALISPDGSVHKVRQNPAPAWMTSRLPEATTGPCLEVEVPPGYAWLVYRTPSRWSVRPLQDAANIPAPTPSGEDYAWAYAVISAAGRSHLPIWQEYVATAEAIAGKRGV
ncbi:hypothetical protein ACTWJ9_21000 [Streptomyces sp. GDS52]|uniref:hypothetical protein n=1 Tax=Streptomyces sp. GDS52 TaxID=3406419 RepID=UPI003FD1D47B